MPKRVRVFSLLPGLFMLTAGLLMPAISASAPAEASAARHARHANELSAQSRPHITVRPRRLGPNAVRHCSFWLSKEYRASGTVVTPQQRCWWN